MNLLIVDDHTGMRAMIRDLVGHLASQILECASGEEAIDVCAYYAPDCITMDLRMGGMNGIACIRRIRAQHPAANIAVVTQFDHDTLRAFARSAGADTYIAKDDLASLKRYVELLANDLQD